MLDFSECVCHRPRVMLPTYAGFPSLCWYLCLLIFSRWRQFLPNILVIYYRYDILRSMTHWFVSHTAIFLQVRNSLHTTKYHPFFVHFFFRSFFYFRSRMYLGIKHSNWTPIHANTENWKTLFLKADDGCIESNAWLTRLYCSCINVIGGTCLWWVYVCAIHLNFRAGGDDDGWSHIQTRTVCLSWSALFLLPSFIIQRIAGG